MIRRTYAPAQPTLTSGDDRVQGACVGRPEPFDDDRCGSTRGYDGHRKRKEKPCDECKAAAAKAKARRLQARRRATA